MAIPVEVLSAAVTVNTVLSVLINSILIYLILFYTQRHMLPYSRLMLIFSIFNILFTLLNVVLNPVIFCEGFGFVMFSASALSSSKPFSFLGLLIYASAYAQSLVLLCYHFIYRYALICQVRWLERLSFHQVVFSMIFFYILMGGGYGLNVFIFLLEDQTVERVFDRSLNQTYGENIHEIGFLGGVYYIEKGNSFVANTKSWLGLTICMVFIASSFVIIIFCGRRILHTLKEASMSNRTRKRQMGIFQALVVQTMVPLICMYIPSGVVLLCPIFEISVDTHFVTVFFGIYCTLEPAVMIYFIKDYRRSLLRILHLKRPKDDEFNSEFLTKDETIKT